MPRSLSNSTTSGRIVCRRLYPGLDFVKLLLKSGFTLLRKVVGANFLSAGDPGWRVRVAYSISSGRLGTSASVSGCRF
jgi:hypothetical protein